MGVLLSCGDGDIFLGLALLRGATPCRSIIDFCVMILRHDFSHFGENASQGGRYSLRFMHRGMELVRMEQNARTRFMAMTILDSL